MPTYHELADEFTRDTSGFLKLIEELKKATIRFDELGTDRNFGDADEIKLSMLRTLEDFVNLMIASGQGKGDIAFDDGFNLVKDFLFDIADKTDSLPTLLTDRKNDAGFQLYRADYIDKFRAQNRLLETRLQLQRVDLRVSQIFRTYPNLTHQLLKIERLATKVETESDDLLKMFSKVREQVSLAKTKAVFGGLVENHLRQERFWAGFMIFWMCVSLLSIRSAIYGEAGDPLTNWVSGLFVAQNSDTPGESPSTNDNSGVPSKSSEKGPDLWYREILRRLLEISVPLVFLRIGLQKYNTERHMRTTYEHRNTLLEQLETIEVALAKNEESKAALCMEVARTILSAPISGYLNNERSVGDVNIGIPDKLLAAATVK